MPGPNLTPRTAVVLSTMRKRRTAANSREGEPTIPRLVGLSRSTIGFKGVSNEATLRQTLSLACFLQLGTPGQATHSSNRRMISMRLHPNRMREPHNMKGTP